MGLDSVGDLALNIILTKLGPKETAKVSCVSKRFKDLASEESLWSLFCLQDLDLSAPLDHHGNPLRSFKATYKLWREAFCMYPWSLVKRVKSCWDRLKSWLTTNFPEVKATLGRGASEGEIQELERILKVKLPLPTRLLYRFHDGQNLTGENLNTDAAACLLGLIGGYCFNDHLVNFYLLPLHEVILETREIVRHLDLPNGSQFIVVAASSSYIGKFFFLNCSDGQLYVGTQNLLTIGEMIPCVPQTLISPVHDFNIDQQQDAMLLWLEEHGHRLHNGMIKLRDEGNIKSISLFPEESPLCSTAVTNGVKVRASAIFVPEAVDLSRKYLFAYSIRMSLPPEGCIINGMRFSSCQLHLRHWVISADDTVVSNVNAEAVIGKVCASAIFVPEAVDLSRKYLFAYSIRMSLPPEGCIINGMRFSSCQLHLRHWVISADDTVVSNVNAEAVIGKFPLLLPGEKEFVYESCTPLRSPTGSVEGSFTFVPGRLIDPKGMPFEAEVARFPLQLPDYIF